MTPGAHISFFVLFSFHLFNQQISAKESPLFTSLIIRWEQGMHPDSVVEPERIPILNLPLTIPARTNSRLAGDPKINEVPDALPFFTPGEEGIFKPVSVPAKGKMATTKYPSSIQALPPEMKDEAIGTLQYLDIDQGMNSSYVQAILEDSRGYLWIGTSVGVSRYDGNNFIHYGIEEGLSNNSVAAIMEDSNGHLWFGTKGGGVTRYDGHKFIHYSIGEGMNGTYVESIIEDRHGNIWFGYRRGGGISRYDGDRFTHYTKEQGLISNNVRSLLADASGNVWIGTGKGVSKFDGKSFTNYTKHEGLLSDKIECFMEDKLGNIWMGSVGGGVCRFDGINFTHYTTAAGLSSNTVLCILEDQSGDLWFGTRGRGLIHFDGNTFFNLTSTEGLSNNIVTSIREDSQGKLWFGTEGGGINHYDPVGFKHFGVKYGLSHNNITSIFRDSKGDIWFGTRGGGVNWYDGHHFRYFNTEDGLSSDNILSIMEDSQGNLWLGTDDGGVNRYDGSGFTHFSIQQGLNHPAVLSMLEDSKGNLWIGTRDGINRLDSLYFTSYRRGENLWISSILEDKSGNIWFGASEGGVICFDGRAFKSIRPENTQSFSITNIIEDHSGNLWFGTEKSGVFLYDGKDLIHYSDEDGLSNNSVRSIVEDNRNNIWISTGKGLTVMVPEANDLNKNNTLENGYKFLSFGKADGLKRWDFTWNSACLDDENQIWLGSSDGLIMLDLNTFSINEYPPVVGLNNISVSRQFVDFRRIQDSTYLNSLYFGDKLIGRFDTIQSFFNYPASLVLPFSLNHLTFEFSGIDWSAPHGIQYSYMMDGLDENWSQLSTSNKAEYRNMPFGKYTFKVRATGNGKTWSEPQLFSFSIRPPWWRTWWAYFIYGSFIILCFWTVLRYEINRHRLRHQLELENIRANELSEINKLKSRFFANVSHEFRTPLTLMMGPVKELINRFPKSDLNYLRLIEHNSSKLLGLINQLLDLSKLDASELKLRVTYTDCVPFLRQIFAVFETRAVSQEINYHFHTNVASLFVYLDLEKLEKILINLLGNAFKFTPKGGDVLLDLNKTQERILIIVSDSGRGVAPEDLPHIFNRFYQGYKTKTPGQEGTGIGLALVKELVHLHHGTISVESIPEKGSKFIVILPVGKDSFNEDEIYDKPASAETVDITLIGSMENNKSLDKADRPENEETPIVLLIEDNADMRNYIRKSLGNLFKIVEAHDGAQGLNYAIELVPDFIISDVMMPVMDGYEVCQKIKSDPRTSHIPIVLLTAKADIDDRIKGLEKGADAYLEKPFNKQELLIRLEKLIELRKQLQKHYQNLQSNFSETNGQKIDEDFIQQLQKQIEDHLSDQDYSINQLCKAMSMSRAQLYRKVKALTGDSVGHIIRTIRLKKAALLLKNPVLNISEIAYEVGFRDPAYFSRTFRDEFGMSPSEAR